nr:MAG TPA: hypothetical protein [Caudoviricetes sp.]
MRLYWGYGLIAGFERIYYLYRVKIRVLCLK